MSTNLAELKALAQAATKGPWHASDTYTDNGQFSGVDICADNGSMLLSEDSGPGAADAAFIAAANPAVVLDLVAQLEAAKVAEQPACTQCLAKQAKIDALMLEHCPNEMTSEQMAEWGKHQRPVGNMCDLTDYTTAINYSNGTSTALPVARLSPAPVEAPDDLIERLALKHIATSWKAFSLNSWRADDYKKTLQFQRLKAYTRDLLSTNLAAPVEAKPTDLSKRLRDAANDPAVFLTVPMDRLDVLAAADYIDRLAATSGTCVSCDGTGRIRPDEEDIASEDTCERCGGSGNLAATSVRDAALEEAAVIAETPFGGEQDDITMEAKDRVAAAIRDLSSTAASNSQPCPTCPKETPYGIAECGKCVASNSPTTSPEGARDE